MGLRLEILSANFCQAEVSGGSLALLPEDQGQTGCRSRIATGGKT